MIPNGFDSLQSRPAIMDPSLHQLESPRHTLYPKLNATDSPVGAPLAHTSIDIGVLAPVDPSPYVTSAPSSPTFMKVTMDSMWKVVGRWSKMVGGMTKGAEDLSRNVWQHLRTGGSITEVAIGRIAHSTKVKAEADYDEIFRQTFDSLPEEQLKHYFSCYLSTSAGPVKGKLYISTVKLAFSSDNPLSYKVGNQTEWNFYKVAIPLHQLRAAKSSGGQTNTAGKYIQIVCIDSSELWFTGFVSYEKALKNLEEALKDVYDLNSSLF